MFFKISELDPTKFISTLGLALKAGVKKTEVKLNISAGINVLLMEEKGIKVGIYHCI